MSGHAIRKEKRYTWHDYTQWPEDERWELIGGRAYAMSPSPSYRHQVVSREFTILLSAFFREKKCQVLGAPMDVKLSDEDVVQPDLVVVCDQNQIRRAHIEGPPSLLVEIASPSSEVRDRHDKLALYTRFSVREYWIITPSSSLAEVYILDGDTYRVHGVYKKDETLSSPRFEGLAIDLANVFTYPPESGEEEE